MTVLCDVEDCSYNINGSVCGRDVCLISKGLCEWVYNKRQEYQVNPYYNQPIREDNNEQEEI